MQWACQPSGEHANEMPRDGAQKRGGREHGRPARAQRQAGRAREGADPVRVLAGAEAEGGFLQHRRSSHQVMLSISDPPIVCVYTDRSIFLTLYELKNTYIAY